MARDLDFQRVTITISNHFEGPNFVNGLAKQDASYTVVSDTRARLEFAGGFDSDVTYVQIVSGTGFGIDANGRYTGVVESYVAFEKGNRANGWSFENLDTSLDRLNTLASDPGVSFEDLLLIPLEYEFVGAQFDDVFICGSFDDVARGFAGERRLQRPERRRPAVRQRRVGPADRRRRRRPAARWGGGDALAGGDGDDRGLGGRGGDALVGNAGNDGLLGGAGGDRVRGGAGSDRLRGGGGDDRLRGGDGGDVLSGGAGDDALLGQGGGDSLEGGGGDDRLDGGAGTNFLFGQSGDDALFGAAGSDELFGGAGADRLAARAGADFLIGGAGDDRLSGNAAGGTGDRAVDTFIFEDAFGDDVVTDFEVGFDGLVLAAGITAGDVTTEVVGDDVLVRVDLLGEQTILVEGVAGRFDPAIDILFG